MMYVIIAYVIDSYILLLLYLSKVFPFSGIFLGDLMRYSMRPTLGNYFEVEPGSGIIFLK